MAPIKYQTDEAQEVFYHNWQMPSLKYASPSLEEKAIYGIKQKTRINQNYSEDSKYSEQTPNIPGYYLG